MSVEGQAAQERGQIRGRRMPAAGHSEAHDTAAGARLELGRRIYLLDADDELAGELDVRMRLAARQITTARTLEATAGECDLEPWFEASGSGPGLLILDGVLAAETRIADRTATELLGAGDLVQPTFRRPDE